MGESTGGWSKACAAHADAVVVMSDEMAAELTGPAMSFRMGSISIGSLPSRPPMRAAT